MRSGVSVSSCRIVDPTDGFPPSAANSGVVGITNAWMFHCRILNHAGGGLMGMVEVGTAHTSHEKP